MGTFREGTCARPVRAGQARFRGEDGGTPARLATGKSRPGLAMFRRFCDALSDPDWLDIIRGEVWAKSTVPLKRRAELLSFGFRSNKATLFDFDRYDPTDYVSDVQNRRAAKINATFRTMLTSKLIFNRALKGYLPLVPILGYYEHYRFVPLDDYRRMADGAGDLDLLLHRHGSLILKPNSATKGRAVTCLSLEKVGVTVNGQPIGAERFDRLQRSLNDCIVQKRLAPDGFGAFLYPRTLNTMRLLMLRDPRTQRPFLAGAIQRIGNAGSFPTDNFARGALAAEIDPETGMLGAAVIKHGVDLEWHERHPDTGALIKGQQIPHWHRILARFLDQLEHLPFFHFVGWDVAFINDDLVIVEGNHHPEIRMHQIFTPLLRDARVRAFFEHHRLL